MPPRGRQMKIVLLGEGRVGKTSLLERFIHDRFDEECPSTAQAGLFARTSIDTGLGQAPADVHIWDTAGQERYHALGPIYYRNAHGAVLVYDITDPASFERARIWLRELHQVAGSNIQVALVGNKSDLERERKVPKGDAESWADANGAEHYLCSARLGVNVQNVFKGLAKKIECRMMNSSDTSNLSLKAGGSRGKGVKISMADDPPLQRENHEKEGKCSC